MEISLLTCFGYNLNILTLKLSKMVDLDSIFQELSNDLSHARVLTSWWVYNVPIFFMGMEFFPLYLILSLTANFWFFEKDSMGENSLISMGK